MWRDTRLIRLLDLEVPIVQAPMAGHDGPALAAAVSAAGGLGSVGCAVRSPEDVEAVAEEIRRRTDRPFNFNFFCHRPPSVDQDRARRWLNRLAAYYDELGIEPPGEVFGGLPPFGEWHCDVIEKVRPPVVSFHFGLPEGHLLERVQAAGCRILCTATTPEEAVRLAENGVDAVIAQGAEAGGHRGVFAQDWRRGSGMIGTFSLVPQVADAVDLPVIAAGGIADGRGIAAGIMLGASGVQIGTAYLFTPEAAIDELCRQALAAGQADETCITNVFTGRPARGLTNRLIREVGPLADDAPDFPLPSLAAGPLRAAAEVRGSNAFTPVWAGQSVALGRVMPAAELTRLLAREAQERLACDGERS